MAVSPSLTGPSQTDEPDLNLLPWHEPITPRRIAPAAAGSIAFHVVVIILWVILPDTILNHYGPPPIPDVRKAVKIYAPKMFELTQKDPNNGKVTHELDVRSMHSESQPQSPRHLRPSPPPGPIARAAQPAPPTVIEPPKIELPKIEPPKIDVPALPAITAAAPKPVQAPQEKPKLMFEEVGPGPMKAAAKSDRTIPLAKDVPQEPLHKASTPTGGGGAIVGDLGDSSVMSPNSMHAPSSGDIKSNLQLLSDPKGVDFKPYMVQVLMAVRRNWLAIIPESARAGRRGRVIVQFAIDRTGGVPKVVIAEGAGTDAFDRAAVAAISASVPLPPLPPDYRGDQIRLQFAFSYNMPAH
jgi:TonB family protein